MLLLSSVQSARVMLAAGVDDVDDVSVVVGEVAYFGVQFGVYTVEGAENDDIQLISVVVGTVGNI